MRAAFLSLLRIIHVMELKPARQSFLLFRRCRDGWTDHSIDMFSTPPLKPPDNDMTF